MHSLTLSHSQEPHSGIKRKLSLSGAVKYILPAILLVVAVFELSPAHLVMLTLASAMVLAVVHSIDKVSSIDTHNRKQIIGGAGYDGGSFHQYRPQVVKAKAYSDIRDGGSFERAPLSRKV